MHLAFLYISLYTSDDRISSLFLNLDMALRNSTLEGFTYIWQSIHLFSDILLPSPSLGLKVPTDFNADSGI